LHRIELLQNGIIIVTIKESFIVILVIINIVMFTLSLSHSTTHNACTQQ